MNVGAVEKYSAYAPEFIELYNHGEERQSWKYVFAQVA